MSKAVGATSSGGGLLIAFLCNFLLFSIAFLLTLRLTAVKERSPHKPGKFVVFLWALLFAEANVPNPNPNPNPCLQCFDTVG